MEASKKSHSPLGEQAARWAMRWAGTSRAFLLAVAVVVLWLVTGPFFGFSDTWQLIINTGTTIVTFIMVFLIHRAQNKESEAVHLKLNEILAALEGASNRMINIEELSEAEVEELHRRYHELLESACREENIRAAHSIEEERSRSASRL